MKKLLLIILSVLLGVFVAQNIYLSPCSRPIYYKVDTTDPKFNLPREEFIEDSKKAAAIWNEAYGKDLLVYGPEGKISVNLIYDERQRLNSQIANLEKQLNSQKVSLDPQIVQFQKDQISFEKRLVELNSEIEGWNQKGGAPNEIYNQLIQKQKDLQNEADRLNAQAKNLNLTAQNFNTQIGNFNQQVNTFNAALVQRPEEGIYISAQNRIEIYFYTTKNELIHTIAHELGHARGLEHVTSPKSVMHSKTNETLAPSKEDLDELTAVCAKKSLLNIGLSKARVIIQNYRMKTI